MPRKQDAIKHFKRVDPHFYQATRAHHSSLPELVGRRTRATLFASLTSTVISQQLATKAADSIRKRVKEVCGGSLTPESILKARETRLRAAGLSGAKIKTLKEIARAVKNKKLDLLALQKIPEEIAGEKLMEIWGLGPWSVEMFLMFGLGRSDVFSVGDLGLVRSMEAIYALPKNAPRTSLLSISEKWSPYRTYAAMLLWRTRDAQK